MGRQVSCHKTLKKIGHHMKMTQKQKLRGTMFDIKLKYIFIAALLLLTSFIRARNWKNKVLQCWQHPKCAIYMFVGQEPMASSANDDDIQGKQVTPRKPLHPFAMQIMLFYRVFLGQILRFLIFCQRLGKVTVNFATFEIQNTSYKQAEAFFNKISDPFNKT